MALFLHHQKFSDGGHLATANDDLGRHLMNIGVPGSLKYQAGPVLLALSRALMATGWPLTEETTLTTTEVPGARYVGKLFEIADKFPTPEVPP